MVRAQRSRGLAPAAVALPGDRVRLDGHDWLIERWDGDLDTVVLTLTRTTPTGLARSRTLSVTYSRPQLRLLPQQGVERTELHKAREWALTMLAPLDPRALLDLSDMVGWEA